MLKRILQVLFLSSAATIATAYTPLLDEVEGVPGSNTDYYLIFPAIENLDPAVTQKAYFIVPKYLTLTGQPGDGSQQFGFNHRGFSYTSAGTVDVRPTASMIANVETYRNDAAIAKIQAALTKRDLGLQLQAPVFPTLVFEETRSALVVSGVASSKVWMSQAGGGVGMPWLFDAVVPGDVLAAFVVDTPPTAGRLSAMWGVRVTGVVKGFGNRLDCRITMFHKKVYEHFKARASVQAYWGLVKADMAKEVKSMISDKSIQLSETCRGTDDDISKMVMPIWAVMVKMIDDDGDPLFNTMVQSVSVPGHPEASNSGWGFQASASWATVSATKRVEVDFNLSHPIKWELPMSMTFPTTCKGYQQYFINVTNPAKPCVDPVDFPRLRTEHRRCVAEFLDEIKQMVKDGDVTEPEAAPMRAAAKRDGCGWDGSDNILLRLATAKNVERIRGFAKRVADARARAAVRKDDPDLMPLEAPAPHTKAPEVPTR